MSSGYRCAVVAHCMGGLSAQNTFLVSRNYCTHRLGSCCPRCGRETRHHRAKTSQKPAGCWSKGGKRGKRIHPDNMVGTDVRPMILLLRRRCVYGSAPFSYDTHIYIYALDNLQVAYGNFPTYGRSHALVSFNVGDNVHRAQLTTVENLQPLETPLLPKARVGRCYAEALALKCSASRSLGGPC